VLVEPDGALPGTTRLGRLVVVGDEGEQLGDKVLSRIEVAVADDLALQDREEQLD